MDREPKENRSFLAYRHFRINQATSSDMANNGALDFTLDPFTSFLMTKTNYGLLQNNAQIVHQANNYSDILNENIEFGVDPNNNTVHQQSNQSVQAAGLYLQHNQLYQSPMNYVRQEPANYLRNMISPITNPVALFRHRPIIIDGLNIGYAHGHNREFSAKGMQLCVDFFRDKGYGSVRILIPQHYRGALGTETHSIISLLINQGHMYLTPSRQIANRRITCYGDRIILDHANTCGGVVVSNDNFRDLYEEGTKYHDIINNRHLMFMFIGDEIIFPNDQYGKLKPKMHYSDVLYFPAPGQI